MTEINLKFRDGKQINIKNVIDINIIEGFIIIRTQKNKINKFEPVRMEDLDYWEEVEK
jgi:hypothetical protein